MTSYLELLLFLVVVSHHLFLVIFSHYWLSGRGALASLGTINITHKWKSVEYKVKTSGMSYASDWHINTTLEMTSDAPKHAGQHITLNIACARSHQYTTDWVVWLVEITLCVMTLSNFPLFVGPNFISDGPKTGLLIHQ